MKYFKSGICSLLLVLCFFNTSVFGEENAPPIGLTVSVFEVAPGTQGAFEEVSMKFKAAADKLEGIPSYFAFSPVFGNERMYSFASPFRTYAELADQREILTEAYEPEEVARLVGLIRESVVDTASYIVIPRPDLGIPGPNPDTPPEIVLAISITVKPNMDQQFEDYVTKLVEATKATDESVYWSMYEPGWGGGRTWGVRISTTWENMDSPPGKPIPQRLTEHFGKRTGERIFQDGQDAIESIETSIQRYRADLSHIVDGM